MQLSEQITDAILPVIIEMFDDTGFNCTVTLRQVAPSEWDEDLRRNVSDTTETSLTAIQMKQTRKSIERVLGVERAERAQIQVGDRLFLLKYSDVATPITTKDLVVYDGQTLKIVDAEPKFKLVWVVSVKGT
jgi:hypothetical protein